jgi:hypothetical protein
MRTISPSIWGWMEETQNRNQSRGRTRRGDGLNNFLLPRIGGLSLWPRWYCPTVGMGLARLAMLSGSHGSVGGPMGLH